jgi:uncharacterized membrane protein
MVLAALVVACGETSLAGAPCPDGGTDLTYEDFGRGFMAAYCDRCHASDVEDRQGAPGAYVFDSQAQVVAHAERVFARAAGDNVSMPPGPDDPPDAEREALAEWLACGAP